jgi:hypothetical protein
MDAYSISNTAGRFFTAQKRILHPHRSRENPPPANLTSDRQACPASAMIVRDCGMITAGTA